MVSFFQALDKSKSKQGTVTNSTTLLQFNYMVPHEWWNHGPTETYYFIFTTYNSPH